MPTLMVSELGDYLKEQRQNARLSLRQLAEQAGVSNPYLSQVERGLRKPSAEVLQQIAKGLRISAEVLYVRAGILEDRGDRIGVEAAVMTDPFLSERQRRVLLDIYQTFLAENDRDDLAGAGAEDDVVEAAAEAATSTSASTPAAPTPTRAKAARKTPASKQAASKQAAGKQAASKTAAAKPAARKSAPAKPAARKTAAKTRTTTTEGEN